MPIEFPAVADIDVVQALKEGAIRANVPYRLGITQSKDSFYSKVEPDRMPTADHLKNRWKAWVDGGAVCSEMESSTLFIISIIHRKRAGGVMLMAGSADTQPQTEEEFVEFHKLFDVHRAISTAIERLKILIENDLI